MRRTFGIGLAVAAFALAAGCGTKPGTSAPSGPAGIEGGWTLIKLETDGKAQDEALKKMSVEEKTIKASKDKMTKTIGGKDDPLNYKLDPAKTPPEVDMSKTGPDGKAVTMYGIYKLEGDILTICAVASEKPADRPKEFKTAPGDKTMIMTLKKD